MKKKFTIFAIGIFLILSTFFYLILNVFFLSKIVLNKKEEINNINHIKYYLSFTHHVREFKFLNENKNNFENLFFTKRNFENIDKLLVFQGDSWVEQNFYKESSMYINNFLIKNNLSMIDAGITSYSVSPMTLQLRYIKNKKKYVPDIVIALIDHTDFNDEWCRYKNRIVLKNNKIDKISIENDDSNEIYNYKLNYHNKLEKILNSGSINLIKLIKIFWIKKSMKSNLPIRCNAQLISNLSKENITQNKINYFKKMTNLYIDEVFDQEKEIKLVFITHPWKIHKNENNVYLGKIIKNIIDERDEKSNIFLIDFKAQYPTLYLKNKIVENQIHVNGDPTYHLDEKAHLVFIKFILDKIISIDNK